MTSAKKVIAQTCDMGVATNQASNSDKGAVMMQMRYQRASLKPHRPIVKRWFEEVDLGDSPVRVVMSVKLDASFSQPFPEYSADDMQRGFSEASNSVQLLVGLGTGDDGYAMSMPTIFAQLPRNHGLSVRFTGAQIFTYPGGDDEEYFYRVTGDLLLDLYMPRSLGDQFVAQGDNTLAKLTCHLPNAKSLAYLGPCEPAIVARFDYAPPTCVANR
jgi:hypothetical protein